MRSFVLALAALALVAAAPARAADATADAHYQTLLAAAKTVDPAEVDWQALRFAYADSSSFDLMGEHTDAARRAMFEALNKDDDKTVIEQADKIVDADYVDIDAHVALDLAYQATGQSTLSAREHQIALGLLKSVHTGDGTTPEQAFTVISVGEEYATMRAFGLTVTGQALIEAPPHSYDRLTVTDGAGKTHTVFFLVDRVMAAESALMKSGK
ncbi:MAG TPA: DUF4919 domain-containing protein [Caulobacteraceae bacterium]|nr:DUF4919 domain-containing protein [Caulobacteraceae bacterium]